MNTIDSTTLIELAEADYIMLKEKGKKGEKVLHYNGFLDGFARGLHECSNPWHKASEELPRKGGLYICADENKHIVELAFCGTKWVNPTQYLDVCLDAVLYWMEIPELPKEN